MNENTFIAKWITPGRTKTLPFLKKDFFLNSKIQSAKILISGLGLFDLYINGVKAHDTFFEPGESVYEKTVFYVSFDVTDYIKEGDNEIKVYLGNGFYHNEECSGDRLNRTPKVLGERMLLCQLEITLDSSEKIILCSDESWSFGESSITESIWLGGETFDQRITEKTLDTVTLVEHFPWGKLKERPYPPVKITETLSPVSCRKLSNGNYLIDFGKNFAGTYCFSGSAPKGTRVNFYFGEVLNEEGSVDQRDFWGNIYDTVIFGEQEQMEYTPRFVYHGFRYIEIEGLNVSTKNFKGFLLHCDNKKILRLETDQPKLNQIHQLICRSIEDNMQSVLTDCPHREKLGWTEVYHLLFETIAYNYDTKNYYKKLLWDLADAQNENGSIPSIVPPFTKGIKEHALREGSDETPNDPAWCGAIILAGYKYHLFYNDKEFLQELYPSMKRYLSYLTALSEHHLLSADNLNRELGDWMAIEPTTVSFAVSCTYYRLYDTMDKITELLGLHDDYKTEKEYIRLAIHNTYYHDGIYDNGTQSATVLAISCGISKEEDNQRLADYLHASIQANNFRLTVGEVALKPLFDILCAYGYPDTAYQVLLNTYGVFADTHTTLPESWDGRFSQNHAMLGAGDSFFVEHLAGIKNTGYGFGNITISPYFPPDMNQFHLVFESPNGIIEVGWERHGKNIELQYNLDDKINLVKLNSTINS